MPMIKVKHFFTLTFKIRVVILVSFLFLEFLLLVFNDLVFRNSLYEYDPDMGYKARPYAQWGNNITNEFGFNDRDYGIEFIVVAYPNSFQVDESLRHVVSAHYQLDTSAYQLDRPQGRLWQFCTELNIEFYDMLPSFQEAHEQGQRLYIHNDTHWNEAGNELAAQYLFDVLIWKARENLN